MSDNMHNAHTGTKECVCVILDRFSIHEEQQQWNNDKKIVRI